MTDNTTAKASDHVKPCNIAQSERQNRRDTDYIKSFNPSRLYIRVDLSRNNESYVAPENTRHFWNPNEREKKY